MFTQKAKQQTLILVPFQARCVPTPVDVGEAARASWVTLSRGVRVRLRTARGRSPRPCETLCRTGFCPSPGGEGSRKSWEGVLRPFLPCFRKPGATIPLRYTDLGACRCGTLLLPSFCFQMCAPHEHNFTMSLCQGQARTRTSPRSSHPSPSTCFLGCRLASLALRKPQHSCPCFSRGWEEWEPTVCQALCDSPSILDPPKLRGVGVPGARVRWMKKLRLGGSVSH